ncbi:hypothetical protein Tco_1516601 [Tanacetum coccineum]
MVQLDYNKLNALYETFVLQKESSVDQTYFSIPSTSNICSESNEVKTDSQISKMPKESKLLKMFEKMALAINALWDRIDVTFLEDRKRRWMSDSQNSLREFYKTDIILMFVSLSKTLKELKQELMEEVHRKTENELLDNEIGKFLNDSNDIQANLLKRFKILENDFKRSQAQKRENIKLEHQKLFNLIKATRAQHQQEVNELIENISQKTYAYGDVRSKNQDLLMVIFELKEKLKTFKKGKDVNTKFDKSVTSGKLLCVTPMSNNIAVQAKKVSNPKDNTYRSKPVTSHSTLKSEQKQKKNANVIAQGMSREF